ncbi:hypothetical protein [Bradyrhizobium sp. KB893862 SZCCT0404]|nr:hypothetical protein [Bradyrhizobium sp. KB893862 SZCCT0404]
MREDLVRHIDVGVPTPIRHLFSKAIVARKVRRTPQCWLAG